MKSQYTVFVVDDDIIFLEMLKDQLMYNPRLIIEGFSTGEECLNKLHRSPDIIVLDYFLNIQDPNAKDGLKILKEIKTQLNNVEIIVLSGQLLPDVTFDFIFIENITNYIVKDDNAFKNLKVTIDNIIQNLDAK